LPGRLGRWLPPVAAALAIASVLAMQPGSYTRFSYLGLTLGLGGWTPLHGLRHVFAIQALIGFIFALHVEDRWQHVAACMYIAGAFAAPSPRTMSRCSSSGADERRLTFLVWLRRVPASPAPASAISSFTS